MHYIRQVMRKKSAKWIVFILAIISILGMDEIVFQMICFLVLLVCMMSILVKGINKGGLTELVVSFFIYVAPKVANLISDSKPGEIVGYFIRLIIEKVLTLIGVNRSVMLDNATCVLVLVVIIFLFFFFVCDKDRTAMKKVEITEGSLLDNPLFMKKAASFCNMIEHDIRAIDRETNWNEDTFTPIEAEVEYSENGKKRRKYEDLLKSLKRVKDGGKIFLVIGEPGSGKSVSLRKLTLELLEEVKGTGKIPIYINLKKWNKEWSINNLPQMKDLIEYIKKTLSEKTDFATDTFLTEYFDVMLEEGRWYFIFDSFDEMPCLAGTADCQELIDTISSLLYELMDNTNKTGGIIASRPHKAPNEKVGANVMLKLQRFDDIRIQKMLKKYLMRAEEVVNELFGKREDLTALCRNPFCLSLLIEYAHNNGLQLPENQMDLYRDFIDTRLEKCKGRIENEKLTINSVLDIAKKIALLMFQSTEYGLEYPLAKIEETINSEHVKRSIDILEYAKICRVGGENKAVSFVHRRFQEFFLMEGAIDGKLEINTSYYQDIINNARLRDALVLYCEIADEKKSNEIAQFCWSTIKKNECSIDNIQKKECLEVVHALYFLAEAFRNREKVLEATRKDLYRFIIENIGTETDVVVQRAMVSCMVLLDQNQLANLVLKVFCLDNQYLCDVVIENCRTIKEINYKIEEKIMSYIGEMKLKIFWERFRNIHFSLSLSREFKHIKKTQELVGLGDVCCLSTMLICAGKVLFDVGNVFPSLVSAVGEFWQADITVHQMATNEMVKSIVWSIIAIYVTIICTSKMTKVARYHFKWWLLSASIAMILSRSMEEVSFILIGVNGFVWMIIVLTTMVREIDDWKKNKRRKNKNYRDYIKATMIILTTVIVTTVATFFIEPHIIMFIIKLFFVIEALVCGVLCLALAYKSFVDYIWFRKHKPVKSMTRSQLEKDLKEIKLRKNKGYYVEILLQARTELQGSWEGGKRPCFKNHHVDYCLAKLDCIKMESCNYFF